MSRPLVRVHVYTPYFEGDVWAVALKKPPYSLVVGNQVHFTDGQTRQVSYQLPEQALAGVTTRAAAKREAESLQPTRNPVQDGVGPKVDLQTVKGLQAKDTSLTPLIRVAHSKVDTTLTSGSQYVLTKGVLYSIFHKDGCRYRQLVVPEGLRPAVLSLENDAPCAGHLGFKRTQERMWQDFYCPGMTSDVRQYFRSCDTCQRTTPKGQPQSSLGHHPTCGETL
eukprot:TRINITY_DN3282_c0_g1_i4.p1 TRINITY_DN3282_c0_g1~~TRINITY_DN3282_c0_g1_i4.p1  ORF type:complete len:223 (+),score=22.36 TRINITY_DN3282_c0_g1_i4:49-717(+)